MLCQHCKKNIATVNYVEIINGDRSESHLCEPCYAYLSGELNSKANNDAWADLFGTANVTAQKVCPVCGTKYSDYERTGLLGCASCYDMFKEELMPSIQRIQGKTNHVGKAAKNHDDFGLHRRLKNLQEQLEIALKERRYSEANRLNRQINEITKTLYGGGESND